LLSLKRRTSGETPLSKKMVKLQEIRQDVLLGDERYFQLATGGTPSTEKKEYWENGTIPWLSSGEVHKKIIRDADGRITEKGFQHSNARFYPSHSILIALAGQGKTRGTIAITEIEATSNQSIAAIIPNKELVEPYFVYYYLDSLYQELRSISAGAGRAGLSLSILADVSIKLPDKPIQERIAAVLSCVDHAIEQTEAIINKQQRIKTGLMQDLLTKGIDEHGDIRSKETHEFWDSPIGQMPAEWEVKPLLDALDYIDAGKSPTCLSRPAGSGEWGILKVSAIRPDGFRAAENKAVINLSYINKAYEVKDGDLLISRANTYELVGLTCLVRNPPTQLMLCDKTLRLNVNKARATAEFLDLVMQMPCVRSQIEINATGSSSTMKNISQKTIENLFIPIPKPDEQELIVKLLSAQAATISTQEKQRAKLMRVKTGLMQALLTGKKGVESLTESQYCGAQA
jgi:type I restriction enzyme S subunit